MIYIQRSVLLFISLCLHQSPLSYPADFTTMPGFLDLPTEVRFMIYRLLLPKQILQSNLSEWSAFVFFHDITDEVTRWRPPMITTCNIFQVNRQIFKEVHPLLYSQHSFRITAARAAFSFFRQIGQLNRDALREIHIDYRMNWTGKESYDALRKLGVNVYNVSSWECWCPRRGANFFNLLAKCSNATITIDTTFRTLAVLDGSSEYPAFANMHGFKKATSRLCQGGRSGDASRKHSHEGCDQAAGERAVLQRLENGVNRMKSLCPAGCRVHKECTSKNTNATVHLEVQCDICCACAHQTFLDVWSEHRGSIFGLQQ